MSEWISVATDLPKDSEVVLIYKTSYFKFRFMLAYRKANRWHDLQGNEFSDITAWYWQPLPPPPESSE